MPLAPRHRSLAFLCLLVSACAGSACTRVVVAETALSAKGDGSRQIVSLPNGMDEQVLGVESGALTSEASIASIDGTRVCVDLVLRTWQGTAPEWSLTIESDGYAGEAVDWTPGTCRFAQCVSPEAGFPSHPSDGDERVHVVGDTVCLYASHPPRATLRVVARQGIARLAFEWPMR
jgi:hypothetical protein